MKINQIRWIAILGLLAVAGLQYIWLVNTYQLTKEAVSMKSEETFKDALMQEAIFRLKEKKKPKTGNKETTYNINLDIDEDDSIQLFSEDTSVNFNQWLLYNLRIAFQESASSITHQDVELSRLDSIYANSLSLIGIRADVVCCVTDSCGNIIETSKGKTIPKLGILKTEQQPINFEETRHLQAFITNPYWVIFQRMTLLLIASVLIMALVVYCLIHQIRIITRQDKIAKTREDFSYAMIHDMKTPLTSILMGTQILQTGKLDAQPDKREKYFQILKDEGEHLLALTNKVLTLSKLENHQLKLAKEDTELHPMLEDLIEKYTAKADKPIHFSLHLDTESVYADKEFLKEAISNLIDNSIKYSGEAVDIWISSARQADGSYTIKVRDNGFGIPLKYQSRIFEKYERALATDRNRKGGASGFGLGLNYVLRVAEAHGGKVNVESIEGEYSEFSLFLPAEH